MSLRCIFLFLLAFGWFGISDAATTVPAGDEKNPQTTEKAEPKQSFFDWKTFRFEKQVAELYRKKKLLAKSDYPKLRRLCAQNVAYSHRQQLRAEWGKDDDPFYRWMEKHPELLENFLLAMDEDRDNFPAALRIMKFLATKYPKQVEQYPDLTIALAVVWDQPESIDNGSQGQFQAIDAPNTANYEELFLYYSDDKSPYKFRLKTLPWEVLCYVVSHKTSEQQRRWAYSTYGHDIRMLGQKYNDVPWIAGDPPPLSGQTYTLSNMKKYGGVCTCRADFSLALCRTLSVPAFYGGAGWPKYHGGHSWVMWMEFREITPNKFVFTLEQEGRYSERKDYVAGGGNPQTMQPENDGTVLLRFHRLGANISAARHSDILMRIYPVIVEEANPDFPEKLKLLTDINAVSSASLKAWNEIAMFGRKNRFTKKEIPTVLKLYQSLLNDFAVSPNYLPSLVAGLLSFPEIKDQREKLYTRLFALLHEKKRPDLIFEAVLGLAQMERNDNNDADAFKNLAGAALKYYEEASRIEPVLIELEKIADADKEVNREKITDFYARFLKLVLKKTDLPFDYRLDMLRRAESCFEKYDKPKLLAGAKSEILKLEQSR